MKITEKKVRVKIRTNSYIIIGNVNIMPGGRLSDYVSAQAGKFIPVTEARVYPIEKKIKEDIDISDPIEVFFINAKNIEAMMCL